MASQNGWDYYYGRNNKAQSYERAMKIFKKQAQKGDGKAMGIVGAMYHDGEGVDVNYGTALIWFKQAAAQGNADAMALIACMYQYARGVEFSYINMMFWMEKAANHGSQSAKNFIFSIGHPENWDSMTTEKARENDRLFITPMLKANDARRNAEMREKK